MLLLTAAQFLTFHSQASSLIAHNLKRPSTISNALEIASIYATNDTTVTNARRTTKTCSSTFVFYGHKLTLTLGIHYVMLSDHLLVPETYDLNFCQDDKPHAIFNTSLRAFRTTASPFLDLGLKKMAIVDNCGYPDVQQKVQARFPVEKEKFRVIEGDHVCTMSFLSGKLYLHFQFLTKLRSKSHVKT